MSSWSTDEGQDERDQWWKRLDPARLLLALDSSSRLGSVAVTRNREVLAESSWTARGPSGARHLDVAIGMLAQQGLTLRELDGVVVATGPGSFTGIRAGISLAHGLATALDIPVWGVGTLTALGLLIGTTARPGVVVCAVVSAGRGSVHAVTTVADGGLGVPCGAPVTASTAEVADALRALLVTPDEPVIVGGELTPEDVETIRRRVPSAVIVPPFAALRRASALVDALGCTDRPRVPEDAGGHSDVDGIALTPTSSLDPSGHGPPMKHILGHRYRPETIQPIYLARQEVGYSFGWVRPR